MSDNGVDAVFVVVEATPKSLEVARRARQLAADKQLGAITIVANRIRSDAELTRIKDAFPGDPVVGIPEDPAIVAADRYGRAPLDAAPDAPGVTALVELAGRLLDPATR